MFFFSSIKKKKKEKASGVEESCFGSLIKKGGILNRIKVTSTYFPFRNYWYLAYTGFIADLVFRLVNASRLGLPLFRAVMQINYDSAVVLSDLNRFDLLIALGLGVAGALFGALFTKTHMMIVFIFFLVFGSQVLVFLFFIKTFFFSFFQSSTFDHFLS